MLEKIIRIDNVGVFKAGLPSAITLKPVTLLYADNARGKSTLSALLHACSESDANAIQARTTINATGNQSIQLRFNGDGAGTTISFSGGAWSAAARNIHVFNQEFVERNVFAGAAITPDQRASMLELALGADAVALREDFQRHSEAQRSSSQRVTAAENALRGYHQGTGLEEFLALQPIEDGSARIAELDKQLDEAKRTEQVLKRQGFRLLPELTFNFDAIKTIALTHFDKLQDDTEAIVRQHFDQHLGNATERWVSDGLHHNADQNCPFCGQETAQLPLIQAYKEYFNQSYKKHQEQVAELKAIADRQFNTGLTTEWHVAHEFNIGAAEGWEDLVKLKLPTIDVSAMHQTIRDAQGLVNALVQEKDARPLDAIDVGALEDAALMLRSVAADVLTYNLAIAGLNRQITSYKEGLANVDTGALLSQRRTVELRMLRDAPEVLERIAERQAALDDRKVAEDEKNAARQTLDQLMASSLDTFQRAINDHLRDFGALFSIRELKTSYAGGGVPRSEYVLEVRGTPVSVGRASGNSLTFHAALSDGDKRTLAFAFFLARLFSDPDKQDAIVVLDDVFTSLDRHRRSKTVEAVVKMNQQCKQAIVLGHDAYFLRDIQKRMTKIGAEVAAFELKRGQENFTVFGSMDLDDFCASQYYRRYRMVEAYATGQGPVAMLDVAQALRPLVEGHLHRCFLGRFADGLTVGSMIQNIKEAGADNPISMLQPLVPDLVAFKEYADAYHHDTSGGHMRTDVNDGELLHYASAALRFIQSGKLFR